jgi:hypothetical protein
MVALMFQAAAEACLADFPDWADEPNKLLGIWGYALSIHFLS